MSNLTQFGSGAIKSIQRGTITIPANSTSATATITSVVTTKTELRFLGVTSQSTGIDTALARITLTNSTTITATRNTVSTTNNTIVSWELTEYY